MWGITVVISRARLDPQIAVWCPSVKLEGITYWNIVCGRRVGRMPVNPSMVIALYRLGMFFWEAHL